MKITEMRSISFFASSLIPTFLLLLCMLNNGVATISNRKISPPPKPSSNIDRVTMVIPVIQAFKSKIVYDPLNKTTTWKGNDVCANYKGFTCEDLPDYKGQRGVAGVDFNGFGFAGKDGQLSLEGFVDKLPDLAFFHANSNNFTGTVKNIGVDKIRYLYEFDLSNNKLLGQFPYEVLKAKNLTYLDLRFNGFEGRVPPEVFNLDVQVIFINNNNFGYQLPDNLGATPALYLTFANNKFTGPIPSSIGRARNLVEVLFLNNQFSGCLPYEIGILKKITLFDASYNRITGPIPHSFSCLEKIEILDLANNQMYGSVPEGLCKIPTLRNLSLAENYFTQVGPACRDLIKKKYLDINKNCISDLPNQRTTAECQKFFSTPRSCPNEKSLNYIPCKKQFYHPGIYNEHWVPTGGKHAPAPASAPVTYSTLKPLG